MSKFEIVSPTFCEAFVSIFLRSSHGISEPDKETIKRHSNLYRMYNMISIARTPTDCIITFSHSKIIEKAYIRHSYDIQKYADLICREDQKNFIKTIVNYLRLEDDFSVF